MTDRYTRFILTVIAFALVAIAIRGSSPITPAHAAETIECRFSGGVEISRFSDTLNVEIRKIDDEIELEDQRGGSSGSPIYVKSVD